jgi:hypothetical protein
MIIAAPAFYPNAHMLSRLFKIRRAVMSAILPPDPGSGASSRDRFPWSAIVIIGFSIFVVGWMIMTAGTM